MHQYKTVAQTLLVLSILNFVYAGPVVPREVRDTGNDAVVIAGDVTTGSDRRRASTTPLQYSSSSSLDGTPPQNSLPSEGSATLKGPASSSGGAGPSSHVLATGGQVPVHDPTMVASTSTHPLPAADRPAHVLAPSLGGSASSHRSSFSTMSGWDGAVPVKLSEYPKAKKAVALTVLVGTVAGVVIYNLVHKND